MSDVDYDEILDALLESAAQGAPATKAELLARFPAKLEAIERALASYEAYQRLRAGALGEAAPPLSELLAGERLGDFEVVDRLASGGMGVVYRARQLSLGRRIVALKVLATERAGAHGVARFQREALQLAGLHHKHLAEVFGFGEARGMLFFAMRLVEGANLRDVLEHRAVQRSTGSDPREVRLIVERIAEVADALALAHSRGLVHRDVKPSNIVLEGLDRSAALRNGAVLVDFGLARPVDARVLTLSGASPATPSYAPPEQLLGQLVDTRADVFSLGVTLHDLLSSRRPTERLQASAGLEPIRELVPELDHDLAAVISHAVDPEARWRYADAAAFRDDLRAWLAGEPVSARSLPWRERTLRTFARHPRRIARVVLIGLLLVAAVIGLSLGPGAELQRVRSARERFEQGDLLEFAREAADVSSWTVGLLGQRDPFSVALQQVRGARASGALHRAIEALGANDMSGALVVAATALGSTPDADRELLERFFLACETSEPLRARMREVDLETWALLIARLFYERPVDSRDGIERYASFHEAVLSAWRRPELSQNARNYLATALGGVGGHHDGALVLLEACSAPETALETVRLHVHNAARVVRRHQQMGLVAELPFDAYWRALTPIAERLRELSPSGSPYGLDDDLNSVIVALIIAQRSLGASPPGFSQWLPPLEWERFVNFECAHLSFWPRALAAAHAPELIEHLQRAEESCFVQQTDSEALGWMGGLLDERADIAKLLEEFVRAHRAPGELAKFDGALAEARAALKGLYSAEQLDSDTLFGWRPQSAELTVLPGRIASAPPPRDWAPAIEIADVHPNSLTALEILPAEAAWWSNDHEVLWSGAAHAPRARAVTIEREDELQQFVRLHSFGASEIELAFTVDAQTLAVSRTLLLDLQINSRDAYPSNGSSSLQVLLNGVALTTTSAIRWHSTAVPIALPVTHVRGGLNRIQLRLLATSTTPLRVHGVRIVPLQLRQPR